MAKSGEVYPPLSLIRTYYLSEFLKISPTVDETKYLRVIHKVKTEIS